MNIVYFGAAFNPPSRSHMAYLNMLAQRFDHVLAAPNWKHSFGKDMYPYDVRCAWLKQMMQDHNVPTNVELCTLEKEIEDGNPIYSLNVAKELRKRYPNAVRHLAFGYDNILNLHKFHRADELVQEINIYGLQKFEDTSLSTTRSTKIREAIAKSDWTSVEAMTSTETMKHIQAYLQANV